MRGYQGGILAFICAKLVNEEDKRLLRRLLANGLFRKDQLACLASGGGEAIAMDLLTELEDWHFSLNDVSIPVWIYQGEQDPFIPVEYARHLADNLPGANLTLIPDAGHLYPLTEDFQDTLFQRLRQHLVLSGNSYCSGNGHTRS